MSLFCFLVILLHFQHTSSLGLRCDNSTSTYELEIENFLVSFKGATPSFEVRCSNVSTSDLAEFYMNVDFNNIMEKESSGDNGQQYDFPETFVVECYEVLENQTVYSNSTDTNETISVVTQVNITFTATLPNSAVVVFHAFVIGDNSTICYYPDTCFNLSQDAVQASTTVRNWKYSGPDANLVITSTVSTSAGALSLSATYYDDGTPQNMYIPSPYDFIVLHLSEYAEIQHSNSSEIDFEQIGISYSVKDLSPVAAEVVLSLPKNNNTQSTTVPMTINQETDAPSPTNWVAIIVGGIFGLLCFIGLIIVVIVIYKRSKGNKENSAEEETELVGQRTL